MYLGSWNETGGENFCWQNLLYETPPLWTKKYQNFNLVTENNQISVDYIETQNCKLEYQPRRKLDFVMHGGKKEMKARPLPRLGPVVERW